MVSGAGLGPSLLLQERLRWGQVGPALGILKASDWEPSGQQCYRGLSLIANHLLRLDLTAETEGRSPIGRLDDRGRMSPQCVYRFCKVEYCME